MTEENSRLLVLLERSHIEAEDALRALRAKWLAHDEQTARDRHKELERHVQGAIDRDKMRVALGGTSKNPVALEQPEEATEWHKKKWQPEEVAPQPAVFEPPPAFAPPAEFVPPAEPV